MDWSLNVAIFIISFLLFFIGAMLSAVAYLLFQQGIRDGLFIRSLVWSVCLFATGHVTLFFYFLLSKNVF